tara:strand:- start:43 stop:420 length:378 start_codon:yes stop_codon:yes gene_type:complete
MTKKHCKTCTCAEDAYRETHPHIYCTLCGFKIDSEDEDEGLQSSHLDYHDMPDMNDGEYNGCTYPDDWFNNEKEMRASLGEDEYKKVKVKLKILEKERKKNGMEVFDESDVAENNACWKDEEKSK